MFFVYTCSGLQDCPIQSGFKYDSIYRKLDEISLGIFWSENETDQQQIKDYKTSSKKIKCQNSTIAKKYVHFVGQ